MVPDRIRTLRRLMACLLAVCFAFSTAEGLSADVHDGDASGLVSTAVTTHVDAVGSGSSPHGPPTQAPSGHDTHACHCVHAHGGWLGLESDQAGPGAPSGTAAALVNDQAPASHDAEAQFRPPIG